MVNNMKLNITISKKEYESLLEDSEKLSALEAAGVDNWEGYDNAMEMMEDMEDIE
jgi:hypothetical protein